MGVAGDAGVFPVYAIMLPPCWKQTSIQPCFGAIALNIVHPDGTGTYAKECVAVRCTTKKVPQLSAHNTGMPAIPYVIANRSPRAIMVNFNSTGSGIPAGKANGPRWCTKTWILPVELIKAWCGFRSCLDACIRACKLEVGRTHW